MGDRILLFVVGAVGDFLSFILLMRFLMQAFRVSFASPVGDFVLALTNWVVKPLRRVLPGIFGLDWSSLLPAWIVQALAFSVLLALSPAPVESPLLMALVGGALETLKLVVWVLIVALVASAVLSWVNPYSPMAHPVLQMCRPVLRPIQRIVPTIGQVDLSPLVAILILNVLLMVLDGMRGPLLCLFV